MPVLNHHFPMPSLNKVNSTLLLLQTPVLQNLVKQGALRLGLNRPKSALSDLSNSMLILYQKCVIVKYPTLKYFPTSEFRKIFCSIGNKIPEI